MGFHKAEAEAMEDEVCEVFSSLLTNTIDDTPRDPTGTSKKEMQIHLSQATSPHRKENGVAWGGGVV